MIKFLGLEKFMLVAYILPPSVVLQEKAPFEAKAAKRKLDYEKLMTAYNKKQVGLNPFFFFFIGLDLFHSVFLSTSHWTWIHLDQESTEDEDEEESEKSKSEVHDDDDDEELEEVSMCKIHMWHFVSMREEFFNIRLFLRETKEKWKVRKFYYEIVPN